MWWRAALVVGIGACLLFGGRALSPVGAQPHGQADDPAEAALAAARRIFNGRSEPDCETPNPERQACVVLRSGAETAARGVAHIGVGDAEGVGGFNAFLGRDAAGEWRVWFTTQTFYYQLVTPPGEMIVCAEGAGANVRAEPSLDADVVATLPDLTRVTAEEFVLTEEQALAPLATAGAGWYRLSAPVAGWTYSRLLSNTWVDAVNEQPECWSRDVREGVRR